MFGIQFYYTIPASLPQARFFIFSPLFAIHSFYELLLPHGRYALFSAVFEKRAGKLPAECGGKPAPIHIPHAPRRLDDGKPRPVRQPCRFGHPLMRCVLRDALTVQAVKIIFDAGVLRSEIRCDEALFLFRNRRLRPGVIHRMHGFRRRFSYSSSARKSITAVLLATAFCSKGNSAKEVNLSGSAGGSCIPAISERLAPEPEKNSNAINFIVFSGVCYKKWEGHFARISIFIPL